MNPEPRSRGPSPEIDEYLAGLPPEQREALAALRAVIHAAAPEAIEGFSYGIPTFRQRGALVGFGAAKKHCGFYVMSSDVLKYFDEEIAPFDTSKGTIRFLPEKPIPEDLVTRIVLARIAENEALGKSKK